MQTIPYEFEDEELRYVITAMIDYADRADVPPFFHATRLKLQHNLTLAIKNALGDEEHSLDCRCGECRERLWLTGLQDAMHQ